MRNTNTTKVIKVVDDGEANVVVSLSLSNHVMNGSATDMKVTYHYREICNDMPFSRELCAGQVDLGGIRLFCQSVWLRGSVLSPGRRCLYWITRIAACPLVVYVRQVFAHREL